MASASGNGASLQTVVERSAGHELHDDVVDGLVGGEFVNRLDVGMVQAAEDQGLATKAAAA